LSVVSLLAKLCGRHAVEQVTVRKFVHGYLGEDGVFILRLVAHNTNTVTVTEFVDALWDNFKKKPTIVRGERHDEVDV